MKKMITYPVLSLLFAIGFFISGCDILPDSDDSLSDPNTGTQVDYDFSAVASAIDAFIEEVEVVNGSSIIIVTKESGVVYKAAFGDFTEDKILLLASNSKMLSASILMSLVDDDLLEIDDPIADYLKWGDSKPGIALEHLLSNTSGLPGLFSHGMPYPGHICQYMPLGALSECAETIYRHDDNLNPPDTIFQYGGGQWHVAGALAEAVSGQSWAELVQERLADPCGLEVLEYGNPLSSPETFTGDPNDLIGRSNPNLEGGAISDLDDFAKILMMQLNDGVCGEERVLSEDAIMEMRTDRASDLPGSWGGYGFGLSIELPEDGSDPTFFSHGGMYGTQEWIDIERGYGVFLGLQIFPSADYIDLLDLTRPLIEAAIDNPN